MAAKPKAALSIVQTDFITSRQLLAILKRDPGKRMTARAIVLEMKMSPEVFDHRAAVIRVATRLEEEDKIKAVDIKTELGWRSAWFVDPPKPAPT